MLFAKLTLILFHYKSDILKKLNAKWPWHNKMAVT